MLPGYQHFNPLYTQKWHNIFVLRLTSVPHNPPKTVGPSSLKYVIQALLLSPALRNTDLDLKAISSKFECSYFTTSAKQSYRKRLMVRITVNLRSLHSAASHSP